MSIQIDPEIANLCRTLTEQEQAQLEANLQAEGCRDPLVLWGEVLLDGHNRHEICHRLGLEYDAVQVPVVASREDAINWVIANQLGRRNLNLEEASYLRGKRYNAEKRPVGGDRRSADQKYPLVGHEEGTAGRLAATLGVSSAVVKKDGAFAAAVDTIAKNVGPDAAREIRSGKAKVAKSTVRQIGKLPPPEQKAALQKAKKKRRANKPKPSQGTSMPSDLTLLVLWLKAGSMHASQFKTGKELHEHALRYGVELREDHITESHTLLSGLIEARAERRNGENDADAA